MPSYFVPKQLYGRGKTDALNSVRLTSSARKLMSARWPTIAGTPPIKTERRQLRSVCPCTRKIMELASAGKAPTTLIQLSTTTNTTVNTVRVV